MIPNVMRSRDAFTFDFGGDGDTPDDYLIRRAENLAAIHGDLA